MSRPIKIEPDKMLKQLKKYIKFCKDDKNEHPVATMIGFCKQMGVNCEYVTDYKKYHPEVAQEVQSTLEDFNANQIATGKIPQAWGIFYFKNKFKYTDKQEIEQTVMNVNRVLDDDPEE